jgi:hypothetical protein
MVSLIYFGSLVLAVITILIFSILETVYRNSKHRDILDYQRTRNFCDTFFYLSLLFWIIHIMIALFIK